MKKKFINKIGIIISWPREIDIFKEFFNEKFENTYDFIINDVYTFERGRNKSNQIIIEILKNKNIKFKLFTQVHKKEFYKIIISTGEISSYNITFISILKFLYANTIGVLIEYLKISKIFNYFLKKPLTASYFKNKIGQDWYPEKELGKLVVKFPDGADLKLKNYPYPVYDSVFDIFLSYINYDLDLVKKKFKKKICKKISYIRYDNSKNFIKENIYKNFNLDQKSQNKLIFWMPTHLFHPKEEDRNLEDWIEKLAFLNKNNEVVVRPHPKTLLRNKNVINLLKKNQFNIDTNFNSNIGNIIRASDLIISDYGGIIFDSIYLNKKIILLNMFKESEFVKELVLNESLDILIRKDLIFLNLEETSEQYKKKINEAFNENYQLKIDKIREDFFGPNKGLSLEELNIFLKSL